MLMCSIAVNFEGVGPAAGGGGRGDEGVRDVFLLACVNTYLWLVDDIVRVRPNCTL